MENSYLIAEPAGSQAVADIYRCPVPGNFVEIAVDLVLRDRVQGSGGLVQDDEGRVLVEGTGKGDFLGFPAGYLHP